MESRRQQAEPAEEEEAEAEEEERSLRTGVPDSRNMRSGARARGRAHPPRRLCSSAARAALRNGQGLTEARVVLLWPHVSGDNQAEVLAVKVFLKGVQEVGLLRGSRAGGSSELPWYQRPGAATHSSHARVVERGSTHRGWGPGQGGLTMVFLEFL